MFSAWFYRPRGHPRHVLLRYLWFGEVGFCAASVLGREKPFGVICFLERALPQDLGERIRHMSKLIRHLVVAKKAETGIVIEADDTWLAALAPTVHELLVTTLKEEGITYEAAGLFIFASQGSWNVSINNKRLSFKRRGEGATVEEALKDLESRIGQVEEESGPARSRKHKVPSNDRNGS